MAGDLVPCFYQTSRCRCGASRFRFVLLYSCKVAAELEEDRTDLVLLQDLKNSICVTRMRAIIEGQNESLCRQRRAICLEIVIFVTIFDTQLQTREGVLVILQNVGALVLGMQVRH